jgi:hypothetical protein
LEIPRASSGKGASSTSSGVTESTSAFLRIALFGEGMATSTEICSISTRLLGTGTSGHWTCWAPPDGVEASCLNLEKSDLTREGLGWILDDSEVEVAGWQTAAVADFKLTESLRFRFTKTGWAATG